MERILFKVGDKITTNPQKNAEMRGYRWWSNFKDKPMTVTKICGDGYTGGGHYKVEENRSVWSFDWVIPYSEEFLDEEEMVI